MKDVLKVRESLFSMESDAQDSVYGKRKNLIGSENCHVSSLL